MKYRSIFLILVLFSMMVLYHPQNKTFLWAAALGVIAGLLMLNKAANIVVLPCLLLWVFWNLPVPVFKRVLAAGLIIVCATLTILPWTIRNYRILGIIVLL